jgi:hypothetical protein
VSGADSEEGEDGGKMSKSQRKRMRKKTRDNKA